VQHGVQHIVHLAEGRPGLSSAGHGDVYYWICYPFMDDALRIYS